MMTSVFINLARSLRDVSRKPIKQLSGCYVVFHSISRHPQMRHTQNFAFSTQPNLTPRVTKTISKRAASKSEFLDARQSVIAYNLSEELKIDNAQRLLEDFKEYRIVELPEDLQEEAVLLSSKFIDEITPLSKEQHLNDIFLFREGSIVFWGVPYDQQKRILYGLTPLKVDPHSNDLIQEEKEHINFDIMPSSDKSKLSRDTIQLALNQEISSLRLDQFAISHAIALSVKLGIWESILDQYIESVGWVTSSMKKGEDMNLTRKQVFQKTGELYELKHCINLSSDLLDLPDVYWDRHDQENLFLSLTSFLNIKRRTNVINEKLNNCCELMNLLASHINDRHHVRLEWMIIILILVEVIFEITRF